AEYVHPEGWKVWQTVSALQQTLPLMSDKNE
ncbi:MAG: protease, partial [Gammaproteobacteria bacterium]|nr:protease [Gammaproteobacteria bacterium]